MYIHMTCMIPHIPGHYLKSYPLLFCLNMLILLLMRLPGKIWILSRILITDFAVMQDQDI